ncbi:porin [Paragemmobacter aquarius]|nr:porin [Gemmobacter aquarius]
MFARTAFLLIPLAFAHGAAAAPVEYVRVCSAFGAGYSVIPGTSVCMNQRTGETREATDNGVVTGEADFISKGNEGTALGLALAGATVDAGKSYGVKANVGTFEGETAIGLSGAIRLDNGITLDAAYGTGIHHGTSGGRVGANFSW